MLYSNLAVGLFKIRLHDILLPQLGQGITANDNYYRNSEYYPLYFLRNGKSEMILANTITNYYSIWNENRVI